MIVVSDTIPLRHPIAIGKVDLLRRVYGAVVVPGALTLHKETIQPTP
jgi:predicted nucleic acid-binding protein